MDSFWKLIWDAVPWVFSGVGVFILGLFITRSVQSKQKQKVSKKSTGYQAGGNITIGHEKKDE